MPPKRTQPLEQRQGHAQAPCIYAQAWEAFQPSKSSTKAMPRRAIPKYSRGTLST
ncbi:hypothetical protein PIB30_066388, partial [Stylosanthes scabra]|nr:hypothetical protein [Stylosanthes scabra]